MLEYLFFNNMHFSLDVVVRNSLNVRVVLLISVVFFCFLLSYCCFLFFAFVMLLFLLVTLHVFAAAVVIIVVPVWWYSLVWFRCNAVFQEWNLRANSFIAFYIPRLKITKTTAKTSYTNINTSALFAHNEKSTGVVFVFGRQCYTHNRLSERTGRTHDFLLFIPLCLQYIFYLFFVSAFK